MVAKERSDRLARFKAAWEAYNGQLPAPLIVKPGQPDDNVKINYCRGVVDKGVAFLFGEDVKFELDNDTETESPAEKWLARVWKKNKKMTLLQKLAINGGVCGQAFLKIVATPSLPKLVVLDPAIVDVKWDPSDIDTVLRYRIEYKGVDEHGKPAAFRQDITPNGAHWLIVDLISRSDPMQVSGGYVGRWEVLAESDWPFDWPPIVDCQNLEMPNEYWGLSDLEADIIAANKAINFTFSNTNRIIRYHAHPKTWARGVSAKDLDIGVDKVILLSGEGEIHNLEMESDLASSVAYLKELQQAFHEVTRIPEIATGKMENIGALSGLALGILYQPLLEKTKVKRLTYGDLIEETNRRLLELGNEGKDVETTIRWPALLPSDTKEEVETAILKEQLGVSQDTLLQELGYDPEEERTKRDAQADTAGDQLLTAFEQGKLQGQTAGGVANQSGNPPA